jgi:hypothetical protein
MNFASYLTRRILAISAPLAVSVLLLAGLWIIYQGEQNYHHEQQRATQVQAEILAASVTAALDFGDRAAAQEAADALRVNPQVQITIPKVRASQGTAARLHCPCGWQTSHHRVTHPFRRPHS